MNKPTLFKQLIVAALVFFFTAWTEAGSLTKFSILPIQRAPTQLPINGVGTAQYLVINNTQLTRTLTIGLMAGVYQVAGGAGSCPIPFKLAPGQTCVLMLELIANEIGHQGLCSGPVVCKTVGTGDNRPDPFLCSQASPSDSLQVRVG